MIATTLAGGKPAAPGLSATVGTPEPPAHDPAHATSGRARDRRVNREGASTVLPGLTRDPRLMDPPPAIEDVAVVLLAAQRLPHSQCEVLASAALSNRLRVRCLQLGVDPLDEVRDLVASARACPQFADGYMYAAESLYAGLTGKPLRYFLEADRG
jgi:hypothetical protein